MIAESRNNRTEGSRGFALLVVLWFLVLIAAIGTYLMANARSETAIAHNIQAAARAEALADAGISQAAFKLTETLASNNWNLDGAPHRLFLPTGEVVIRLHDETTKINPNHASGALMSALFEVTGVDRVHAGRLGEAIADWVSPRTEIRRFGAEQYRDAGNSYASPIAPLETIDDLQLVLGMTPQILSSVRPYLTIYTGTDRPNGKNVSQLIRRALVLAAQESRGITVPINDSPRHPAVLGTGVTAADNASSADISGKPSETVVKIEVRALSADGGLYVRHAVLRINPASPTGYIVLDWHHGEGG